VGTQAQFKSLLKAFMTASIGTMIGLQDSSATEQLEIKYIFEALQVL
jgi:hypothetical protein